MIGKNIDISDKIMRKISTQISVTFLVISLTGFYQYELWNTCQNIAAI